MGSRDPAGRTQGGRADRRASRWFGFGLTTLVCGAVVFGAARVECAFAGDTADLLGMSLEELMAVEVESVVTASLFEQMVTEAPASVTVVTAEDIRRLGYRTLTEILAGVRGMYTWTDSNYDYLGVRGFGRLGDYNSDVLVLIDGHRTNESTYYASSIGREFLIDVDLIDRVEIVRGPSSSLYGTSAFFGVINVITRRAEDVGGVEVAGGVASHRTFEGRLSYGKRFAGGLDLLISGTAYRSDGQDHYYPVYDDPATNNGWAVDCDDAESESLFFKVGYGGFEVLLSHVDYGKTIPTGAWETVFNDPRTSTHDSQTSLGLRYADRLAGGLGIDAHLEYGRYDYDGYYLYDGSEDEEPYLVLNIDRARSQWVIGDAQFVKTISNHRLLGGVEIRRDLQIDQLNYDEEVYLDDRRQGSLWGVFIQDEIEIRDNLRLNIGVRYDHYDTFGGSTNPRLGLIFNPRPRTSLKVLYGTAFRAPSAYELYYGDGGSSHKGNPDLNPETIRTWEVVWEEFIGRGIQTSVSVFSYRADDLIGQVVDPSDELQVFANIDEADAQGVEFEVKGRWWRQVKGYASVSYQEVKDASTDELFHNSPRYLGVVRLSVPFAGEKLWVSPELLYRGSVVTLGDETLDSALVTNLTILATEVFKGVDLSLSFRNLFDDDYRSPASQEHLQDSLEQGGRIVRARVVVRF